MTRSSSGMRKLDCSALALQHRIVLWYVVAGAIEVDSDGGWQRAAPTRLPRPLGMYRGSRG